MSCRASAATNAAGFDNAGSEWSHVAWAMLMPCGSRKDGIVKGSQKTQVIEILRFAQKRSSPPEGAKGNDKTTFCYR